MNPMKILLLMPHSNAKRGLFNRFTYPSLTLQQIASITPRNHDVDIIDERFERITFNKKYDLIGISCLTYNSIRGYELSDIFRNQGSKVVFGGYHASLLPDEAKKHADSVVIGEAEFTWPQLLKDFEKGALKPFYIADKLVEPELIPPARHDIGVYTPFAEAIQASRGCPTGCEFCAMQKIEGSKFRGRPVENIIDEMKSIRAKTLFFADASLTINPKYTKSLFDGMKEINAKSQCFGNINVLTRDDELLRKAADAGINKWYVGIESISQENINAAGKGTNKVENYAKAIKKIKDHGMSITGFFMFGFDNDTTDIFNRTLQAIYEWELDAVSFSIVTPYPGTRLFERLEKEGRITSYDWSKYTEGNVNFKPKRMTEEELLKGIKGVAGEFFSVKKSFARSFNKNNINPVKSVVKFTLNLATRSFYKNEKLSI
jgi:radical SAM superfamily enzyme YgiQ (UPF0313 family)